MQTIIVAGPVPPPINGASRVTQAVSDEIAHLAKERRCRVHVVSTSGNSSGVHYHLSRVAAYLQVLIKMFDSSFRGPVSLYVGGSGGGGLWYQVAIVAVARLLGVRTIFHHHSYSYLHNKQFVSMVAICRLMSRYDVHVFLTPEMLALFRDKYYLQQMCGVVSNAAFTRPLTRNLEKLLDPFRIVHVSNLSRAKGTSDVIDAFRSLRRNGLSVSLVLVGPVSETDILDQIDAARNDYGESIEYLGPRDADGVIEALDRGHVFAFPSTYVNEAQPMVVLEALSRGLPVVASKQGSLEHLLPDDWLIDRGADLAGAIERIIKSDWPRLSRDALGRFRASSATTDIDLLDLVFDSRFRR
ncbi:MAG: glycosyltransferase family 4 protein [Acidobacteria bacterium]|nr:glycosyltransferase family 4 protein [Acidobacteriota bacterium]